MTFNEANPFPKICYEIFIRSFCDSNDDGVGDLLGIVSKLDYLQNLGIEAIWLTPIHPSPSYHKYDVIDYYGIDLDFGSLDTMKRLVKEAHARGIKILMDLIINHTSTLHPWFIEASMSKENSFRNYYWWKTDAEINELGIAKRSISEDSQEVFPWHENMGDDEKYYGMFYKGMPDLNFHSEALREDLQKMMHYWLYEIQIDGFRIDAARHVFPIWEAEHNVGFWKFFKKSVEDIRENTFTVGEIWAEPTEIAPYYQGVNATFNFELSFALQRILMFEKNENLINRLLEAYHLYRAQNSNFIDAIMLTNHDQDRIGSVLAGNTEKLKLAASILLTLPGQPYIYYGEEIGMLGMKPDPHIREPFLWTSEKDDSERTTWIDPQFSTFETVVPLSKQLLDTDSLFHHYKKLIQIRKENEILGNLLNYHIMPYQSNIDAILGYIRVFENRQLLIVNNLTSEVQNIPIEMALCEELLYSSHASSTVQDQHITLAGYSSFMIYYK